jgi:hypothetical protein
MRWYDRDPTLQEILSDPIFVALMRADNVDPFELEAMLKEVAAVSRSVREADNRQFIFASAAAGACSRSSRYKPDAARTELKTRHGPTGASYFSPRSSFSRRSSSRASGGAAAGAARRRRKADPMATKPASKIRIGASHNKAVCQVKRGLSSTNSP